MSAPSICVSYVPPTENAQQVINKRYSVKDENGNPTETWEDIVNRVVGAIAAPETDPVDRATFIHNATELMLSRKFIPNTPCLVNAGTGHGALAGCYVLPVRDSLKGIMQTATNAALIHQTGGGTGFTFETLRPEGAVVKTHNGLASGPISFMEIFDKVTDVVKQGGVRRGANMGIMRCDHPDILRFIHAKNNQDKLTNFNISVAVTDEFMRSVERREWYQTKFNGEDWTKPVYDPTEKDDESLSYWETSELDNDSDEEKRKQGMLFAPDVWDRIIESAHKWGEPGVVFIDTVNRHNLLMASMGPITATNPCSEQALHNYNSCNLGSIDVSKFYEPALDWQTDGKVRTPEAAFNWDAFREAVYWSVRFLDNVIDACSWPLPEIEDVVKRTRPVGLGIMGFADLLLKLKIRYGSEECLRFLDVLMTQFRYNAWLASCLIGKEKGEFPEYKNNQTAYDEFLWNTVKLTAGAIGNDPMEFGECYCSAHYHPRNYEVTTIAPTGCQIGSTKVVTSKGILSLRELGHTVELGVNVAQENREVVATKSFYNGFKSTKKIRLSSGADLECTPNHMYRVLNENDDYVWRRADELIEGDRVVNRIGGYDKCSEPALLPLYNLHGNSSDINFPTQMNPALAEFIGLFIGDGSSHEKGIRLHFDVEETKIIERVISLGKELFNLAPTFETRENCLSIYFNSVNLLRWLKQNQLTKTSSLTATIPYTIRRSSGNSVRAFIYGLWLADGSSNGNGTRYIDTGSYQLAQDLLVCMRATGQNARVSFVSQTKGRKSNREHYRVFFVGFGSTGFLNDRYCPAIWKRNKKLLMSVSSELFCDTIVSVEDSFAETFDIEVPEGNTYLANSYLSHNTISLVAECSSGIEPNFAWSYTRSDTVSVRKYVHPLAAKELDITFQDPHSEMILSMKKLPDYFVTAYDLSAMDHVKVLATAQKYIDNGVSKTCNGHKEDSVESVKELYEEAYRLGVKSISYYRDGSRDGQVLTQNQTNLCPDCKQPLQITDRCSTCVSCGWGKCSV